MTAKRFVKPENNRCGSRLVVKVNGIFEGIVFSAFDCFQEDVTSALKSEGSFER